MRVQKNEVTLTKAKQEELNELQRLCMDTYSRYFASYWNENGLSWYLDQQFGHTRLKLDLRDKNIDYYFITLRNELVGFAKVNYGLHLHVPFENSAELEKIYVLPGQKGTGVGTFALEKIINMARAKHKEVFFLYVLDSNPEAISFYSKLGFIFHEKIRLELPYFKDTLRGLDRMYLELA